MKSKELNGGSVIIFDRGDEVVSQLTAFEKKNGLAAAHFTAIGAFSDVVLGYFDTEKKEYLRNPVREQVEVVSLIGDIAPDGAEPKLHAHVVIGKRDGSAMGGHLLEAHVKPTLEMVLERSPKALHRKFDPASGLALIDL